MFHEAANVDTTDMNEELMIHTNYTSFIEIIKLCEKNFKFYFWGYSILCRLSVYNLNKCIISI